MLPVFRKAIVIVLTCIVPSIVGAQRASACPDSSTYFDFQVSSQATWLRDSTLTTVPYAENGSLRDLVQFVVDTAGVPVLRTLHVLLSRNPEVIADVRRTLEQWRYTPARLGRCPVRQLVQTRVGPGNGR